MNTIEITGVVKIQNQEDVELESFEVEIDAGQTNEIELELVFLEGGPILRPKNPPQ